MDRKMVEFIKEQYPPGTRIRLNSMDDPYAPIAPGTEGEVDFVDDIGQLHMKWDNGRTLALVPGEDSFSVLPPKLTTLKLYMPLTADLFEPNEYGDMDECSELLEGHELRGYCYLFMMAETGQKMAALPGYKWMVYLAMVIGGALMVLYSIVNFLRKPEPKKDTSEEERNGE